MDCQLCGGVGKVLNSRKSSDETNSKYIPERYKCLPRPFTYRDHKCKSCGHTYQSVQIMSSNFDNYLSSIERKVKTELKEKLTQGINVLCEVKG